VERKMTDFETIFWENFSRERVLFKFFNSYQIDNASLFLNPKIALQNVSRSLKFFRQKGTVCQICQTKGIYVVSGIYRGGNTVKKTRLLFDENFVMMTRDHILAKANGGKSVLDNLQTLCATCNVRKADKVV
jgi:hypothetical protein